MLNIGGADSDVMLDMILRCGGRDKTDFVFFNTGLEYRATLEHLDDLERKYDIKIIRCKPVKPIPVCVKEHGVPFWSKYASNMINRLQRHNFQWEDKPYEVLIKIYLKCMAALAWWCNKATGNTTQYIINRAPYMREFMIQNPPDFKISDKCCTYAKKKASEHFEKGKQYDLKCIGVRESEGGVRAISYQTCFTEVKKGTDQFRPIWYFRNPDKDEYCKHYGIVHSKCYTEYGMKRTGCCGCPFAKDFEDDLERMKKYEPQLYIAAVNIFGESYEYTRKYIKFREEMKQSQKQH